MNNQFYMSDFYCTKCGNLSMSLPRAKKKQREAGHLKNLYCPHCREEHNHLELIDLKIFVLNLKMETLMQMAIEKILMDNLK